MIGLYGDYSWKLVDDWLSLLKAFRYKFEFTNWNGKLYFKLYSNYLSQEIDYIVRFDYNNYCAYAKLPLSFDESKLDEISSYIFMVNDNPMFAHFTLDYDKREIFCVHGACCRGQSPGWNSIRITIKSIESFLDSFYDGLVNIVERNISAEDAYDSTN